jgi:Ca2+-binding EF-hand superfamily protein
LIERYKAFIKDCPSGLLDKGDFLKIYKQYFPFGDPTTFSEYVFNVLDKKRKGVIDFRQFILSLSLAARGDQDEKILCNT